MNVVWLAGRQLCPLLPWVTAYLRAELLPCRRRMRATACPTRREVRPALATGICCRPPLRLRSKITGLLSDFRKTEVGLITHSAIDSITLLICVVTARLFVPL